MRRIVILTVLGIVVGVAGMWTMFAARPIGDPGPAPPPPDAPAPLTHAEPSSFPRADIEPARQFVAPLCRMRLTTEVAIARPVPGFKGVDQCAVSDVVRLEAVVLRDGSYVAVTPPATLRCDMAEALVRWVREDVAVAAAELGAPLRSVDNYASYSCRNRNNIAGAALSEHGKANAIDIRSFKLANGKVVGLTDRRTAPAFREKIRKSVCARFSTVLGPGSDGYHEDHIHVDLQRTPRGRYRLCRWNLRGSV
jgi:hypothetical protein